MTTPGPGDWLDALEGMVEQYLHVEGREGEYEHAFMSAGEEACYLLAEARPDRWRLEPWGLRRLS